MTSPAETPTRPLRHQMSWFGSSWDAPLNDECPEQATPVGRSCLFCQEPIEWWASGVTMVTYCLAGPPTRGPLHLECHLRQVFGSRGHQLRTCHCYGGTEDDPPGASQREAARSAVYTFMEIVEFLEVLGAFVGRPSGSDGTSSLPPSAHPG